MTLLFRTGILALAVWLQLSGISFAKQVFLRDGSVLDCESFWKRNGQIVAKVNRDTVLEFAPEEVDLGKTFRQTKHKAPPIKRKQQRALPADSKASATAGVHDPMEKAAESTEAAKPARPSAPVPPPKTERIAPKPAPPMPNGAQVPATAPVVKVAERLEPAADTEPSRNPAADKAELERITRQRAAEMADAMRLKDPRLLKKSIEAQARMIQQQSGGSPKPEPVWFKYLLMLMVCCLLIVISMWVVFKKAGQSGWKSIIPIYNFFVLMRISGKPGWWCILLAVPVVGLAIDLLAMLSLAEKFGKSAAFAVGLVFLPMFFFPLLAFGGAQYQDRPKELEFTFSTEPPVG
jgi:hypothetical protein